MTVRGEQSFWDDRARALDLAALRREAHFLEQDPLWRWLIDRARARTPARVLDAGCGRGATTLLLAQAGLAPVGVDVSHGALSAARRLAGPAAPLVAAPLEALPFAPASFDLVVGRFVLHHAHRLDEAAAELHRVLRPGGAALFVETWGRNPLLRLGRDVASLLGIGLGTEDERPLGEPELRELRRRFRVGVEFPVFTAFELSNRVWRRLKPWAARSVRVRGALSRAWRGSIAADRLIERRLPGARPWGWFVALVLEPHRP